MEKLTEPELQRKHKELAKELKGCRKRVRDRLARKLNDVKSSDMVGLIHRLKTKLKILDDVKGRRITDLLYKRQRELRQKIAEKKLRETLERGNAKKKKDEPKAVIMVPFTHGSKLSKEMREVEDMMEKLTGSRLKIVEKSN